MKPAWVRAMQLRRRERDRSRVIDPRELRQLELVDAGMVGSAVFVLLTGRLVIVHADAVERDCATDPICIDCQAARAERRRLRCAGCATARHLRGALDRGSRAPRARREARAA